MANADCPCVALVKYLKFLLRGRHSRQNHEERQEPIQEKNSSVEVMQLSVTENEEIEDLKKKLDEMTAKCLKLEGTKKTDSETPVPVIVEKKGDNDTQQEEEKLKLTNEKLDIEKVKLQEELSWKEVEIKELKEEIEKQEELFIHQQAQHEEILKNLASANRAKLLLTARLADQEKKVYELEQSLELPISTRIENREELKVVREALSCLRRCFAATDPYQHTLDTIEQSLASLLERVNALEFQINPQVLKQHNGEMHSAGHSSCFTPNEVSHDQDQVFHNQPKELTLTDKSQLTKVVYYMEKSPTPFMSVIPKRIGDIRLGDFKMLFDRSGNFRYHFKTYDNEFGIIKEEVMHDDEILPGWDGKIIAWVEEDVE
ncbi:dixin-A-like isoform X2 [Limulus polyphemus]|uniref:Dixin-A-like isoform X2 n=1 Tax=Limulus polyphemus TaxID=6850 RepID=A0ABM1SEE5_LIMPO|nr:dixin-A-like isoform X2 [Limulus polyphemus]XP_022242001.1 dixin-A-like isoform X2 [Limulus polyphemus]XP_022242003.1 dixin-A-like isoform X2 [Limulus polyphemus]